MGTNYYMMYGGDRMFLCPECNTFCGMPVRRHIGKSSAGWVFGLFVDKRIPTLDLLTPILNHPNVLIFNEYHEFLTPEEMMNIIVNRQAFKDRELRRHDIDGRFCVGHGPGTWDLLQGEFS
jgi:hypothetical protein